MSAFTDWNAFEPVAPGSADYVPTEPTVWFIGQEGSDWQQPISMNVPFNVSVPNLRVLLAIEKRLPAAWREAWGRFWLYRHPDYVAAAAVHDPILKDGHDVFFASGEFRRALIARGIHPLDALDGYFGTLIVTAWNRRAG